MPAPTKNRPLASVKRPASVAAKAATKRKPSALKNTPSKTTTAQLTKPRSQSKTPRKTTRTQPPSGTDYLKKILTAKVYEVAHESALDVAKVLGRRLHNQVLLKREDQQPVFSFKLRGAYNKMAQLSREQLARGVICASAGNHAQGVALGAAKLGARAVVVMPVTTPALKVEAVKALGAEVVLHGESYSDAHAHALVLQRRALELSRKCCVNTKARSMPCLWPLAAAA